MPGCLWTALSIQGLRDFTKVSGEFTSSWESPRTPALVLLLPHHSPETMIPGVFFKHPAATPQLFNKFQRLSPRMLGCVTRLLLK